MFFGAVLIGVTLDGTTSEAFIVGISKVSRQTFTDRHMTVHFADRVPSTDDVLAWTLAIIEATFISSASKQTVALIVVVASVLNPWCAHPLIASIVW